MVEQVERLAQGYGYEVHVYSQRIEDIEGVEEFVPDRRQTGPLYGRKGPGEPLSPASGRLLWHRIPDIRGPHLVKYLWWLLANQFRRWRDQRSLGLHYDIVYSAGINCWDADAIVVHIVFHEFYRLVRQELRLRKTPLRSWPRALHRKLYYWLIMALEKRIYPDPRVVLAGVSSLTAGQVQHFFGREDVRMISDAVDVDMFNSTAREKRRAEVRQHMGFEASDFVLLLVGNDWRNKGLRCLLDAVDSCADLPLRVLAVGHDDRAPYEVLIRRLGLQGRVWFAEPSADVVQFYAAADAYVGPSLEDAFALPAAEAMACGLPAIVSRRAGVSEIISNGVDGLILEEPTDAKELARLIRRLYDDAELRRYLSENASQKASRYTWERNVAELHALFQQVMRSRKSA